MAADETSLAIARFQFLERARANENDLLAQRATWLVMAQSFLFATFAIVSNQLAEPHPSHVAGILYHVIPIVGLAISLLVQLGVAAAVWVLRSLRSQLIALSETPELAKLHWPAPDRPRMVVILGQLPSIVAPVGLAIVWGVLLAVPPG